MCTPLQLGPARVTQQNSARSKCFTKGDLPPLLPLLPAKAEHPPRVSGTGAGACSRSLNQSRPLTTAKQQLAQRRNGSPACIASYLHEGSPSLVGARARTSSCACATSLLVTRSLSSQGSETHRHTAGKAADRYRPETHLLV
jgi:hypothetical protein